MSTTSIAHSDSNPASQRWLDISDIPPPEELPPAFVPEQQQQERSEYFYSLKNVWHWVWNPGQEGSIVGRVLSFITWFWPTVILTALGGATVGAAYTKYKNRNIEPLPQPTPTPNRDQNEQQTAESSTPDRQQPSPTPATTTSTPTPNPTPASTTSRTPTPASTDSPTPTPQTLTPSAPTRLLSVNEIIPSAERLYALLTARKERNERDLPSPGPVTDLHSLLPAVTNPDRSEDVERADDVEEPVETEETPSQKWYQSTPAKVAAVAAGAALIWYFDPFGIATAIQSNLAKIPSWLFSSPPPPPPYDSGKPHNFDTNTSSRTNTTFDKPHSHPVCELDEFVPPDTNTSNPIPPPPYCDPRDEFVPPTNTSAPHKQLPPPYCDLRDEFVPPTNTSAPHKQLPPPYCDPRDEFVPPTNTSAPHKQLPPPYCDPRDEFVTPTNTSVPHKQLPPPGRYSAVTPPDTCDWMPGVYSSVDENATHTNTTQRTLPPPGRYSYVEHSDFCPLFPGVYSATNTTQSTPPDPYCAPCEEDVTTFTAKKTADSCYDFPGVYSPFEFWPRRQAVNASAGNGTNPSF